MTEPEIQALLRPRTPRMVAWALLCGGLVVLTGWWFSIPMLKSVFPGLPEMASSTALGFILVGAALLGRLDGADAALSERIGLLAATALTALASATLTEITFDWELGIEAILTPSEGGETTAKMSSLTTYGLLLLGVALLNLDWRWGRVIPSQILALVAMILGAIGLLRFAFGENLLYSDSSYTRMSLHGALFFVASGAGILLTRPQSGILRILLADTMGGRIARRYLPFGLALPVLVGWAIVQGIRGGILGPEMGFAAMIALCVMGLVLVIWHFSNSLDELNDRLGERHRVAERLRHVVDDSSDAIITKDHDGIIRGWNPAAERIFGYTEAEIVGRPGSQLMPLDRIDEETEILRSDRSKQESVTLHTVRLDKRGFPIQVAVTLSQTTDAEGHHTGSSSIVHDISALKDTENRLANSLRELTEFKTALDAHAIVSIADPRGVITYANDRFCRISGYSRNELTGSNHRILNSGHHSQGFFRELWKTISSGRTWHGEVKNRAKDGSYYWVNTTIVPFFDSNQKPRQYLSIRTEVTSIRESAEADLINQTRSLKRANRDLEQFTYVASHDLKGPLRGIASFLKALDEGAHAQLDTASKELLARAVSEAKHMEALIEGLLAYSRVGTSAARREAVSCDALLTEVLNSLNIQINETGAKITSDPLPVLSGNREQIAEVFRQLIDNALKFRNSGPPEIHVGADLTDEGWSIGITDNGVGIPPEAIERAFVVFQRLHRDPTVPGIGMGLPLCKRIIERHGGRISVESTPGRGSTVRFTLTGEPS